MNDNKAERLKNVAPEVRSRFDTVNTATYNVMVSFSKYRATPPPIPGQAFFTSSSPEQPQITNVSITSENAPTTVSNASSSYRLDTSSMNQQTIAAPSLTETQEVEPTPVPSLDEATIRQDLAGIFSQQEGNQ